MATKEGTWGYAAPETNPSIGITEAASCWGVSAKHLRDLIHDGRMTQMGVHYVRVGKVYRLSRRDVYAALGIENGGEVR